MVKGILADNDVRGQVDYVVALAQSGGWAEFWRDLGLVVKQFHDIGLLPTSSDLVVWQRCQANDLVLITGNRNHAGPESLEATLRIHNGPNSLPVFTIADVDRLNNNRSYAEEVVESLIDYLQRIDGLRGTGRLFLP
jgi:Domain of unknown function (DUF5615)